MMTVEEYDEQHWWRLNAVIYIRTAGESSLWTGKQVGHYGRNAAYLLSGKSGRQSRSFSEVFHNGGDGGDRGKHVVD